MDYLGQGKEAEEDGVLESTKLGGVHEQRLLRAFENHSYSSVPAGVCEKQEYSALSEKSGIQLSVPFMKNTEAFVPRNKRERKLNRRVTIITSVIVVFLFCCFIAVAICFSTKAPSNEVLRAEAIQVQCPNGYTTYESEKCGRLCVRYESNQCKSWFDARQTCQIEGGDLMAPSECSYPFFREQASLNEGNCSHFWIGGRTETPGSNYVTVKGDVILQDSSFSYWSIGQPDGLGGESCLEMRSYFNNYLMNDYHCQVKQGFICQVFLK